MMREENEKNETKEMKQKSIVKKAKKIRSMVMMSLLCVLMLSAATYAWFSLSKTSKVANLTMKVGEATGLQIAKDLGSAPGTYGSVLTFNEDDSDANRPIYKITGKLLPATTSDGINFLEPTYNADGEVDGTKTASKHLTNASTDPNGEGYYYETTFYLKALGEKNLTIKLKDGVIPSTGISSGSETGTYVLEKQGTSATNNYLGSQSIRISLTITQEDTLKTLIYEPNSDLHGDDGKGTSANTKTGVTIEEPVSTSVQSTKTHLGQFTQQNTELTLVGNADTLVTMRIWIQGTDKDCVNEISLNDIIAQLQFEEVTTP